MAGDFPRRPLRPLSLACFGLALLAVLACLGGATTRADAAPGPGPGDRGIVGGTKTTIDQWPWQVALLQRGRGLEDLGGLKRQFCAGSLIAPSVVLTAGHCLIDLGFRSNSGFSVVSGRTTLS